MCVMCVSQDSSASKAERRQHAWEPTPGLPRGVHAPSNVSDLKANPLPFKERGGVGIPLPSLSPRIYFSYTSSALFLLLSLKSYHLLLPIVKKNLLELRCVFLTRIKCIFFLLQFYLFSQKERQIHPFCKVSGHLYLL